MTVLLPSGLFERVAFIHASDGVRLAVAELTLPEGGPGHDPAAPVFLLIHGFAQNRLAFCLGPLPLELLLRGARVFVAELRGHGRSRLRGLGWPGPDWGVEAYLQRDLPAILAHLAAVTGAPRVHYVGHSLGGMLGYALSVRGAALASLTTFAAPVVLGTGRPLVRLAALVGAPLLDAARRGGAVPMDALLGALSGPLCAPNARGPLLAVQRFTALANPALCEPEHLRACLAAAEPESPAVFRALAEMAARARPILAGIDLAEAVARAPLPIAAVVGARDVFAPRVTVAALEAPRPPAPRRVIELPDGTHVDLTLGHSLPRVAGELWSFLHAAGAVGERRERP